ncbi:MAG: putative aminohydrolase SsnA [bacterium]|nr:putative aminohydrolase SsnA [bacterium]
MLITNGKLITYTDDHGILEDGALLIRDGVIQQVGTTAALTALHPDETRIDARGQYVMPGNVCAHTHFYGAYARGMAIPGEAPQNFPEILARLWWNLDKALDADAVRASTMVCLVDAIKHGTTTLFDHHASPNSIDGSLNVIASAVEQAGVRAVLCYEVTDRDGFDKAEAGIAENARFIRQNAAHPRIRGTFGLHASLTLSDATINRCTEANPTDGFHIHVAEHEADQRDSLSRYGKRVVHRLGALGILTERTIAAHCVHVGKMELRRLQRHKVAVTHQPRSNMNNAVGAMRFDLMMADDTFVCLGNDGFSNAMWEEWKAAYLLHKVVSRDPRKANGAAVERVAHVHNNRLASRFFDGLEMGSLKPGAAADIIFVDYHPFTPLTPGNLPWHILFGFESSMVTTTICAGTILMHDRQLITLDERQIAAEALALAPGVWERYQRCAASAD